MIVGNHDSKLLKDAEAMKYIESVDMMKQIADNQRRVVLCHYPLLEWPGYYRNAYHVFGHIHNNKNEAYEVYCKKPYMLNAAACITGYKPVTLDELIAINEEYRKD